MDYTSNWRNQRNWDHNHNGCHWAHRLQRPAAVSTDVDLLVSRTLVTSGLRFVWGQWRHYGLATLYPVVVLSLITLISAAAGVVDLSHTNWGKALLNIVLTSFSTFMIVIITEEGFFRGWLWASLKKSGQKPIQVWVISSIVFSLWHLSWVTLTAGGKLPIAQIPVFILNVAIIGAIWGLLPWISGSVIVASLSHGVWNGITYVLFGFGAQVGALGIKETAIYGPEIGVLGLVLNFLFAAVLWPWMLRTSNAA
jgi:membrane protease YdiL (CAAX protease family)